MTRRPVADPMGSLGHRVQDQAPASVRIVGSGVDTLYLACRGELYDGLIAALTSIRALSTEDEPPVFQFRGNAEVFMLRRHGWRGYPFSLRSLNYELRVGAAKPFPPLYVEVRSTHLHALGADRAVDELADMLSRDFFDGPFTMIPSRMDVYADVQGWEPHADDLHRFMCRGVRRRLYEEARQLHSQGSALSGLVFGSGDVLARIYCKTLELKHRGETWPRALWRDTDPELPVWRVEFQFRRPALADFGVETVTQVLRQRQALWEYGTRWLSLRVPTGDSNRARWPESPIWRQVRAAQIGLPSSRLVRKHVAAAEEVKLIRGFLGYISSLGALKMYDDLDVATRCALPAARRYLEQRGVEFAQVVEQKRRRRLEAEKESQQRRRVGRPGTPIRKVRQ